MSRLLAVFLAVCLCLLPVGGVAAQSGTLVISTAYPVQEVRAGESLNVGLEVKVTDVPAQIIRLDIQSVPEGWRAVFQGGGRVVQAVQVEPAESRTVTLNVQIPLGIKDGAYRLVVVGRGEGVQASLPLEFIVGESLPPSLVVEPELPTLKGTPASSFTYRLKIKNASDQDTSLTFDFEAPDGFDVTFRKAFSSQELANLPIKANQTESVDVVVRPASGVPAGEYPLRVRTQSEELSSEVALTAVVTGKPDLALAAPDGRLSGRANAGQESPLELLLKNEDSAPVTEIHMEATAPAQWSVTFEPELIENLEPNQEVQVIARVKPPQKAIAGDYGVTLRAVPAEGDRETAEFRITVVTSTLWGAVGLVLIAGALGVVALAVARFGRR